MRPDNPGNPYKRPIAPRISFNKKASPEKGRLAELKLAQPMKVLGANINIGRRESHQDKVKKKEKGWNNHTAVYGGLQEILNSGRVMDYLVNTVVEEEVIPAKLESAAQNTSQIYAKKEEVKPNYALENLRLNRELTLLENKYTLLKNSYKGVISEIDVLKAKNNKLMETIKKQNEELKVQKINFTQLSYIINESHHKHITPDKKNTPNPQESSADNKIPSTSPKNITKTPNPHSPNSYAKKLSSEPSLSSLSNNSSGSSSGDGRRV